MTHSQVSNLPEPHSNEGAHPGDVRSGGENHIKAGASGLRRSSGREVVHLSYDITTLYYII